MGTTPTPVPSSPDLAFLARRSCYAVRVVSQCANGTVRTRLYASLAAAERAVRRSLDRGLPARLDLVHVKPAPASVTVLDIELEDDRGVRQ